MPQASASRPVQQAELDRLDRAVEAGAAELTWSPPPVSRASIRDRERPLTGASLGKNTGRVSPPPDPQQKRRVLWECYELRDCYRPFAGERCAKCGRVRIAPSVEISKRDGRAHYHGLMRCGLAWECPVCQVALRTGRAAEVLTAVRWQTSMYGVECAALLTLTVRHGLGHDIRELRAGVARAWRRVQEGQAWRRWKLRVGLRWIRSLDLTYGENGWHPHLHIVLLTSRPLSDADRAWLSRRWRRAVLRTLGPDHVPDDVHGCDLRPCHKADYLQKLGLEVSPPAKSARGELHRTPLQLLTAFVDDGDYDALELYQVYADGMKGARVLTWSANLKRDAGVLDQTDQEIVEGEDALEEHVATIKGEAWDQLRDMPGIKSAILAVAESEPPDVVREWLGQLALWRPGYDPCECEPWSADGGNGAPGAAQAPGGVS